MLAFAALRAGALNWRLHVFVQLCTFVLFPVLGLALNWLLTARVAPELNLGLFYLCALPSTVSSSIAMTAAARGNVAGAVFNATLSSLIGVVATPLWVAAVMKTTGETQPVLPVVLDLLRWLVLPLALGQLSRPLLGAVLGRHKSAVHFVDRGTILLLVYTSMCESFRRGIWSAQGPSTLALTVGVCATLLALVLTLTAWAARALGYSRADRLAAIFCGSKKTLASGVPMANLIFGPNPALGVILLPIMIYHPLQLVVCGVLAERWGRQPDQRA
jgi:sodium/bile acid cotransporter 7